MSYPVWWPTSSTRTIREAPRSAGTGFDTPGLAARFDYLGAAVTFAGLAVGGDLGDAEGARLGLVKKSPGEMK
jgi:hypothetical protein